VFKIENAKALNFDTMGGLLNAIVDEPLFFQNDGLGLKVRLWLEKYSLNLTTHKLLFQYQTAYEYMVPSNKKEELEWAKNRFNVR